VRTIATPGVGTITDHAGTPESDAMKMPRPSWRPTTGQLTTAAVAVVFLLVGFWIGWQHRSTTDPQTITPTVPRNMRTKAVVIVPSTGSTTSGTSPSAATTTTAPAPANVLVPRAKVNVAVLNAGGRTGAAVQVAVTLVRLGYPTPYTGNVTLPAGLVPTGTSAAAPAPTATAHTGSVPAPARTGTATRTTTGAAAALPEIVYYRTGDRGLADRLASDLGVTATAPMPSSVVIQAAAPSAQLVVVIGT
jgi:hypothetical protein